jgi:CcmD family protein
MDPRNAQFLFLGFTAAWVIMLVYIVLLSLRDRKLRQELERVRRMVEESGRKTKT